MYTLYYIILLYIIYYSLFQLSVWVQE